MNSYGLLQLLRKEIKRFMAVYLQTIAAPVISSVLYLVIFYPFGSQMQGFGFDNVDYGQFLIPGLLMMAVLQNSFANSSSSIIQAKNYGNILFMLVSPLSSLEILIAFVGGAIARGTLVAVAIYAVGLIFHDITIHNLALTMLLIILCSTMMGAMGLIAGVWSRNYDHLAGFQNFVILPLTFLSGVFYSTHNLPAGWKEISLFNPFFYMIDALRYSILGVADTAINFSLIIITFSAIIMLFCAWLMLFSGYGLKK